MMPIEHIPDWEKRLQRQDAFWQREIIDRPVTCFAVSRPNPDYPAPAPKHYATHRERWMDAESIAERTLHYVMNTEYCGDLLPSAPPNLGPEVFSAFFGCEMEYTADTSWAIPNLESWDDLPRLKFSRESFYWKKLLEVTDALLERGRGKYYVGIADLHPGADAIAAFRDPQQMNFDMIEAPEQIKALLEHVTEVYFEVFDFYHDKLTAAGQACTNWAGIVSSKKWYVPSNDFSCMISKPMFDEFFLPGIIAECRHMEANIYHLDGPDALRHLDSLLEIKELNAIQWTIGAGNGSPRDWIPTYQKCQAAGKGLQISPHVDELDILMEHLKPEGLWLSLWGVQNREHGEALLKKIAGWR